jgi:tRNA threonylcarbamoyladenosine biosynthesis protein TsaE
MQNVFHIPMNGDLSEVCAFLCSTLESKGVWVFRGAMGAGKTTLISALCRYLGVEEHTSSPTFSLVNEYHGAKQLKIFHFDFYRIRSEAEAMDMGVEEYFDGPALCLVEWPERVENLLPSDYVEIKIEVDASQQRKITITYP